MSQPKEHPRLLAIVPARGGSKGIPNKNIYPFCGIPLLAHTIFYARRCPEIDRLVVSTDYSRIAEVAINYHAKVQQRPPELAQDDTPIWAVLRYALQEEERRSGPYDYLALLEPTSPLREVGDLAKALQLLEAAPQVAGVIAVAPFRFNPAWNAFTLGQEGYLEYLLPEGARAYQRQMVPRVYHHSGELYLWRASYVRDHPEGWQQGRYLPLPTPPERAVSIDTLEELRWAERLVEAGMVELPWLS